MDQVSAERIGALQHDSLTELADRGVVLGDSIRDLADLLNDGVVDEAQLRAVFGELAGVGTDLEIRARGYREVRATDIVYPRILDELSIHGWAERPLPGLSVLLPPVPLSELGQARGLRRGWQRGAAELALWFSAPTAIVYGVGLGGPLFTLEAIRGAIGSGSCRCCPKERTAQPSVDVLLWEPAGKGPFGEDLARIAGRKRVRDVIAEIRAAIGRLPDGAESLTALAHGEWPEGQIIAYPMRGTNEGYFVCVDVINDGVWTPVISVRSHCEDLDAAWMFARQLADLLGA
jgi:hypothetical protein